MVDRLLEIIKFNGHPMGYYMANQIVSAGYGKQMIETFYDPFEFWKLYNWAAKKNDSFQLSDDFMEFIFVKREWKIIDYSWAIAILNGWFYKNQDISAYQSCQYYDAPDRS